MYISPLATIFFFFGIEGYSRSVMYRRYKYNVGDSRKDLYWMNHLQPNICRTD